MYYIDPDEEEMKIAYPTMLFDRNIADGRAMMCSILTLTIGNNQSMGDVEHGKIYDIYFPPKYLRLFDGPSCSVVDMLRILGRGTNDGELVVGTIAKMSLLTHQSQLSTRRVREQQAFAAGIQSG